MNERWRGVALVLAAFVVAQLFFLPTAFRVDDTNILAIARQIAKAPLDPYGFTFNWTGTPRAAFDILANPPLVPADPFHGTTTPGVMIWVHDVIAPAMLVSLVVAVRRVWKGPTTGSGEGHSAAPLGSWRRWKGMT